MPSIHLPYVNIALNAFALIVTVVIFLSCYKEYSKTNTRAKFFLYEIIAIAVALTADTVAWLCEGHTNLSWLNVASNTVAMCFAQIVVLCFLGYLKENLYESSVAASFIIKLFSVLCGLSLAYTIGNAFFGYVFSVNENGHWHHTEDVSMGILYLLYPMLAFLAIILMAIFARSSTRVNRAVFVAYTAFPVAGMCLDYVIHGISLTYVGLTLSALVMYTSIYLKKKKLIEWQRSALMLSQINPHFIYNTLSTIAAMCDVSPSQAKHLTIDFSRYLRHNLSSVTNESNIPFEEELNHVECYLKIEKARFRERLNVIYSINCKDFEIPPLSVQPIVENAVKHGITKQSAGGTIKISTFEEEGHYVIEIIDDGVGFDVENTEMHVGIQNVRSRIMSMCKGELTIKSTKGVGTRVTIEIPRKKGRRK